MPKNVTVTWKLPTSRQKGGPLPVDEIDHTLVELSADGGANFVNLQQIPPTALQEVMVPDVEQGEWHFRITVIDTLGQLGAPHIEIVEVADDSPPDVVTDVTSTQS
jgi:hypothetical protein